MTLLQNRLVRPDASPIVGRQITATLMSKPSWIVDDSRGRALGSVTTYTMGSGTDASADGAHQKGGLWQLKLIPADEFEGKEGRPYVWYQIDEGDGMLWAARFVSTDGETVWLKDHLIDPPNVEPQRPIVSRLADLHDIDSSITSAPEGSVLVKRGDKWTPMSLQLATLNDVDRASMTNPMPGDSLTYIDGKGWGIDRAARSPLTWRAEPAGDGRTVSLSVTSRLDSDLYLYWGDEQLYRSAPEDLPVGTDEAEHTYAADGSYAIEVGYQDESLDEGRVAINYVTIPLKEAVEGSNE